jgi:hypothetical protein
MTSGALFCDVSVEEDTLAVDLSARLVTLLAGDLFMRTRQGKSSILLVIESGRPPTGGAVAFGAVCVCFASPELAAVSILMAARANPGSLLEGYEP